MDDDFKGQAREPTTIFTYKAIGQSPFAAAALPARIIEGLAKAGAPLWHLYYLSLLNMELTL